MRRAQIGSRASRQRRELAKAGRDDEDEPAVMSDDEDEKPDLRDPVARFEESPPTNIVDEDEPEATEEDDTTITGAAFPVLAGVARELVALSPLDHREVCPTHGWIGRLAFQRDHHDKCVLEQAESGTSCRRCNGLRLVTAHFCGRCSGTGIDPNPDEAIEEELEETEPEIAEPVNTARHPRPRRDARGIARAFVVPIETSDARAAERLGYVHGPIEFDLDELRPKTRGECLHGIRPCPWAGCKYHLLIDVDPDTGSLKMNFPNLEIEDLEETCALDVADRGGVTLEVTGQLLNLTRERARQVEAKAERLMKSGVKHVR